MSNLDSEYKKYSEQLGEWEKSIGLNFKEVNREKVEELLSLEIKDVRLKETMELNEDVFVISQYLMFLQKKSNECDSYLKWLRYSSSRFFGEEKSRSIVLGQKAELRQSKIAYMTRRVEYYCQAIQGIIKQRNVER